MLAAIEDRHERDPGCCYDCDWNAIADDDGRVGLEQAGETDQRKPGGQIIEERDRMGGSPVVSPQDRNLHIRQDREHRIARQCHGPEKIDANAKE